MPNVRFRVLATAMLLTFLTLPGPAARAQATETALIARLKDKPLYIRGFWDGKELKFDAAGQPIEHYGTVSFTLSAFQPKKIQLQGDTLEIEGKRMGIVFDGQPAHLEDAHQKLKIEIEGHSGADFGPALDAIFATDLDALKPSLPDYWRDCARNNFQGPGTPSRAENRKAMEDARKKPLPVKAPKLISMVEPTYSSAARAVRLSGNTQVYLWVGPDGVPSHMRIVRPLGMGLDENAIAAVSRYRFLPATQNGQPVKVDLYIEVNFQVW